MNELEFEEVICLTMHELGFVFVSKGVMDELDMVVINE